MRSTSFRLGTLPCQLIPPAGIEIKNLATQPSYFQINRTDPKGVFQAHWVLEPLHWNYICGGAVNWPFDLSFGMEEGAACGNAAWVPTSDVFPSGTFVETCLTGITNTATWDFHPYKAKPHL